MLAVHQSLRPSWIASHWLNPRVNATNAPIIPNIPCSDHHTCSILHNHLDHHQAAAAAVAGRAASQVKLTGCCVIQTEVISKSKVDCLWLQIQSLTKVFGFQLQSVGWAFHQELIVWRCLYVGWMCGRVSVVGVWDHMVMIPITKT